MLSAAVFVLTSLSNIEEKSFERLCCWFIWLAIRASFVSVLNCFHIVWKQSKPHQTRSISDIDLWPSYVFICLSNNNFSHLPLVKTEGQRYLVVRYWTARPSDCKNLSWLTKGENTRRISFKVHWGSECFKTNSRG